MDLGMRLDHCINECFKALQVTRQWKLGIGKGLICRYGVLNGLCSALIRFGAAIDLEMHYHGDINFTTTTQRYF